MKCGSLARRSPPASETTNKPGLILCHVHAAPSWKPARVTWRFQKGFLMSQPIPAVAYYRMSTDRQEESIDRQKSQVEPYAARQGYLIVREYVDEGIAGDEEGKRKGFM